MKTYRPSAIFIFFASVFTCVGVTAQGLDPTSYYVAKGKAVTPWELSLNFTKIPLTDKAEKTTLSSLMAAPAKREADGDAWHFKWQKRDVKNEWGTENQGVSTLNLTNKQAHIDLSSVKDQVALVFDVKILKAPDRNVNFMMECNWDWKCRSTLPLKKALKKLPKKKWISVPIALTCLDNGKFDFSKITTTFSLYTEGKMELELGDVRLAAFPADKANCGKKK